MDKPEFRLTPAIGEQILAWCQQGSTKSPEEILTEQIDACNTYQELKSLFTHNPKFQQSHLHLFSKRKNDLVAANANLAAINSLTSKFTTNGNGDSK